jgi:hypothetical protein
MTMTRITLDDELREKLLDFKDDVELCDNDGRVVARVQRSTPWNDPDNWTELTPDITDEEWQRIKESGDFGISTQELINHLKGLV